MFFRIGCAIVFVVFIVMYIALMQKDNQNTKLMQQNQVLFQKNTRKSKEIILLKKENADLKAVINNYGLDNHEGVNYDREKNTGIKG